MASAWGSSWGQSWGVSWGSIAAVTTPTSPSRRADNNGPFVSGMRKARIRGIKRKRKRALMLLLLDRYL